MGHIIHKVLNKVNKNRIFFHVEYVYLMFVVWPDLYLPGRTIILSMLIIQ